MTIREQIIKELDKPFTFDESKESSPYNKLKQCIEIDMEKFLKMEYIVQLEDRIDGWFKGVINSLCYRPNKLCLVFESEKPCGKQYFFNNLFPNKDWFSHEFQPNNYLYSKLVIETSFIKNSLTLPDQEGWTVTQGEYPCDKRLASYCSTTWHWGFPKRKNFIIVPVKKINYELFNSIPKDLLWIEIFNKFKPEL